MALKKRCNIEIWLAHHQRARVYTSGSVINGVAAISANHDVAVVALDISFQGVTRIELSSQYDFRTVSHQFLFLKMPALDEYLPESRVLKAQTTYTIPFDFTVPHRLCIGACSHACSREDVVEKHTRLPPSVRCNTKTDKSPSTTNILYSIKAVLTRQDGGATVADQACQAVVVLPELLGDPPLDHSPAENEHVWSSRTKNIRERRFKAPVGSLTASTSQPHAITLNADGCGAVGSWAQVDFEFVPFRPDAVPPQVQVSFLKSRATTLYSTKPFDQIPQSPESIRGRASETFSHCCTHNCLHLSREISNWEPFYTAESRDLNSRHAYGYSSSDTPMCQQQSREHSAQGTRPPAKYMASLHIPFTLRSKEGTFLLPTFHSCFVSRIYVLQLRFSAGAGNSNIDLVVPLHICVGKMHDADAGELPNFESNMAQDEQIGNRSLCTVSEMQPRAWMAWSGALPPEYEASGAYPLKPQ